MPASSLHRIPNHLSFETAALTEPLAVGVKALLERSRVEAEDLVVVLGSGPVGLLAAAAAKAGGAKSVVVAGTDLDLEVRLPIAREMGLDYAVSVQQADLKDLVSELTDGVGADLVVEASGAPAAINQAFELVRRDGRICGIGLASSDRVAVSWNQGLLKSVTISFSVSTSWTSWERALSLLATGRVDVAPIISGSYPLDDFEEAFSTLENLKAVKNLFLP
jgi:L-iditol 2-dehydrogenase